MTSLASVTPSNVPTISEIKQISQLGKGGFGTAYLVTSTGNQKSVIKVVNTDYPYAQYGLAPQEIMLTCSYRHPNIARGVGVELAENIHPSFRNRGLAVALKLYDQDLDGYMNTQVQERKERMKNVAKIILDLIHGYKALRELGWVHLDMKPQNTLIKLDPFQLVISDFGSCRPLSSKESSRQGLATGTPFFMPPEAKTADGDLKFLIDYDEKFDMYSLGVTFRLIYQVWPEFFERDSLKLFTAQALLGLTKAKAERWTFNDLLSSDFYTYLARLEPSRKYVSPKPRLRDYSPTPLNAQISIMLKQEVEQLADRARRTTHPVLGTLFRHIKVEIISRARQYLVGVDRPSRAIVQAALRIGYKLTQTAEIGTAEFFGLSTSQTADVIQAEEQILLSRYQNMEANSSFDFVGDINEFAKTLEGPVSLIASPTPLLSTNAGGKDLSIINLLRD